LEQLADNFIMLCVKEGDTSKMALLFEKYHKILYSFIYRSIGHSSTSEDILQTVFFRMLKYKESFTGVGEFKTWMYHIARNTIVDEYRKTNKIDYTADIYTAANNLEEDRRSDTILQKKDEAMLIQKALNMLSEDQREVLILSKYQELSYKEIAEILNTNENNIKIKVHRAIKSLKEVYLKIT
jgi:RNA polymerase sigma-70 factor (ECF subfamily)